MSDDITKASYFSHHYHTLKEFIPEAELEVFVESIKKKDQIVDTVLKDKNPSKVFINQEAACELLDCDDKSLEAMKLPELATNHHKPSYQYMAICHFLQQECQRLEPKCQEYLSSQDSSLLKTVLNFYKKVFILEKTAKALQQ